MRAVIINLVNRSSLLFRVLFVLPLLVVPVASVMVLSYRSSHELFDQVTATYSASKKSEYLTNIYTHLQSLGKASGLYMLNHAREEELDSSDIEMALDEVEEGILGLSGELLQISEGEKLAEEIEGSLENLRSQAEEWYEAVEDHSLEQNIEGFEQVDALAEELADMVTPVLDQNAEIIQRAYSAAGKSVLLGEYAIYGLGILLSLLTALFYALMRWDVKRMLTQIESIRHADRSIAGSSQEIEQIAGELEASASNQASTVEQSIQAMKELEKVTQDCKLQADHSAKGTQLARHDAKLGQSATEDVRVSMASLSKSIDSLQEIFTIIENISQKTEVINSIVFQTKLLSVNASIEAARSGEDGNGFAVVAKEIGDLAASSGNAAREIEQLIQQSTEKVDLLIASNKQKADETQSISEKASASFEKILSRMDELSDLASQIETVTKKQDEITSETSSSLGKLKYIVQDISSVSGSTSKLSSRLKDNNLELKAVSKKLYLIFTGKVVDHQQPDQSEDISQET